MKRMKPQQYKGEALRRIDSVTADLIARFGAWNAEKIKKEMEKILRKRRLGQWHDPHIA